MGGFAVHLYAKGIVCLHFNQGFQEWDSPIFLITFDCELDTCIYIIDMIQEKLLMGLFLNDKYVIHKSVPKPGW